MGDRGNIVVTSGKEKVCLYSHWGGSELPKYLKDALKRGEDRWSDYQYLTRIIFCEMLKHSGKDPLNDTTGLGITNEVYDNEHDILNVDVDKQKVNGIPFAEYID